MHIRINLVNVIEKSIEQPALFLLLLHPLFLFILISANQNKNIKYIDDVIANYNIQNRKINEIHKFIEDLRQGTSKFSFSQEFQDDRLVKSMINLREELEITRKEEEQRKKEEQQRHWINEGLAKFGAILRENVDDLEKLASQVTSNLVKYMNVQQAGFFVINEAEGEKVIDMIALFAFDRKKFPDKRFAWGEGLIGACAIEQKTIFIKEATDSFVDITSGLGGANPRSILIVPIKDNNDKVHGVLELASFKVFQQYEIEFAEQVAESIGLTMASIETALTTQRLLLESQKQAEMLAQQEANMRKNIEDITRELEASIEDFEHERALKEAYEEFGLYVQLTPDKTITRLNKFFAVKLGYENADILLNQDITNILTENDKVIFENTWKKVIENNQAQDIILHYVTSNNSLLRAKGKLIASYNEYDELTNVYFVGYDDTEAFIQKNQLDYFLDEISVIGVLQLDADGNITQVNNKVSELFGKDKLEIIEKKFFELFDKEEYQTVINLINNATNEQNLIKTLKVTVSEEENFYFLTSIAAVKGINNEILKYIVVLIDNTEKFKYKEQVKELEEKYNQAQARIETLILESNKKIEIFRKKLEVEFAQKEKLASMLNGFLEHLPKAIIIVENGYVVLFNNFAEKIWGYKKEIANGKKIEYLFPTDEDFSKDKNYLGNLLNKEQKSVKAFVTDRNHKKIDVMADVVLYEIEGKKYTSLIITRI